MIITQTPLRVGLLGGGTDLPDFYLKHGGGRTLSVAIDKYVYVIVNQRFDSNIHLNYTTREVVSRVEDIQHDLIREAMLMTGVTSGIEITTLADIPASGTGLGSSSAVTVGLLNALYSYKGRQVPVEDLASMACEIEIDRCGKPIGRQDQYITALGGIRSLNFSNEGVSFNNVIFPYWDRRELQRQMLLFYTGITRSADPILAEQKSNIDSTVEKLKDLRGLAYFGTRQLLAGRVEAVGNSVRGSWEIKRNLASSISSSQIDNWISRSLGAGASGAKITGAGGGGFLLVLAPQERHKAIRAALSDMREMPIKIDPQGTRVILNIEHEIWY